MKKLFTLLFLLCAAQVHAQHIDPTNTLPSSNSSFLANLQQFLKAEEANRYTELGFLSSVTSGGTHATGAGLTKTPTALIAYPGGYRITETGSIVYPDNSTCYVIVHYAIIGAVSSFTRVSGTHYAIDCTSVSEPAIPTNSARLMTVVTKSGSVTTVTDRRTIGVAIGMGAGSTGSIGDLLYADTTVSFARLAAAATGNALISGGASTAPAWGKIALTTHVSGVLGCANGGSNNSATPSNGQLLIGDGACFTLAALTPTKNVSVANTSGVITVSDTLVAKASGVNAVTASSVAETSVLSQSLAAGSLSTLNHVQVDFVSRLTNNVAGTTVVYTFKGKYGGTTLCTCALSIATGVTALPFRVSFVLGSANSASAQYGNMIVQAHGKSIVMCDGTAAEASVGALNVAMTVTMDTSDVAATFDSRYISMKLFK
jgi:hypothetical protein